MNTFRSEVQTHVSLLTQISDSLKEKFSEISVGTRRPKRGLIDGAGTIFKAITGNLDASDGEFYTNSINRLNQGQLQIENLLKNQISVTKSVMKNFNDTIQKLRIDEQIFYQNLQRIERTIRETSDAIQYVEAKLMFLEICEKLMENYLYLEDNLNDIVNSITFARLKIIHSSILTPEHFMKALQEISQNLIKNNLPLPVRHSNIAQYLEITELEAFQTQTDLVYVLKIPLVDQQLYTAYHLYPIPIYDDRTGLHHVLSFSQKYIAKGDDSLMYIPVKDLSACKQLSTRQKLCSELYSYPIDSNALCEAQLLKNFKSVPDNCQSSVILSQGYNVQKLETNKWLIIISEPLRVTVNCVKMDTKTFTVFNNSVLTLQNDCNAFIGITKVQAEPTKTFSISDNSHPVIIPYNCCDSIPAKIQVPEIKPLQLENLNMEELEIANHKLDQYSRDLDGLINQPFVTKNISWFTYLTIAAITIIASLWILNIILRRLRQRRKQEPPITPQPTPRRLSRMFPKLRPVLTTKSNTEDIELNQKTLP